MSTADWDADWNGYAETYQTASLQCGATTQHGSLCRRRVVGNIGPAHFCAPHLDAVTICAPFTLEGERQLQRLHRASEDVKTSTNEELRQLKKLIASARSRLRKVERDEQRLAGRLQTMRLMIRERQPVALSVRRAVVQRCEETCTYCSRPGDQRTDPDGKPWHIDHDLPVTRGGSNDEGNLVLACAACNLRKGDRTGDEFRLQLMDGAA